MASVPLLLSHPSSLEHDTGHHPERAQRMLVIEQALEQYPELPLERIDSPAASDEQLTRVHPLAYVHAIEEVCAAGGGALDPDTVVSEGSCRAARHAAGGAAGLAELLLRDGGSGFSIHRPPGHHAEPRRAMGFCLFSNIAIAARHAVAACGARRVCIVDFDVHHGNGTAAAFDDSPDVLFCSLHQWPLYPGTGAAEDIGSGAGRGYTVNLPVPPGSGDETFVSLVEHVTLPIAQAFAPDLVLASAGFDAHVEDPLADCAVTDDGYRAMVGSLRRLAAELGVGLGLVLEGGYQLSVLARCTVASLQVLAAPDPPPAPQLAVHPLAERARERHGVHWPAIAWA
jgi:acetoin utilization deacetylase AcuC-like enzyme